MTDPVALYEAWFVPAVFAPLARQVVAQTAIPPGARVLDVACGTGVVARTAAPLVGAEGRVVGLDASAAMLAVARQQSAAEGVDVAWRHGNAQEMPFADGSFDVVFCQHGLQFFPNRAAALAEMHRVLAPGGQVAVVTWRWLDQNPFFAAFRQALPRRLDAPAVEIPFSLGDPAELATLLQAAGFAGVSVAPADIVADYAEPETFVERHLIASAAAVASLQALDAAERAALGAGIRDDLAATVRAATTGDRLRVPMKGIVARGVRR